ncbi:MAG: GNAT family N-acetyltransferase [Ruminococcus sp.]|nr:GNAT family N-acetyltransferase [Ruminococcus sp.]
MKYHQIITLRDGRKCVLRNGTKSDGYAALDNFILAHSQTDWLLSYPDEISFTVEEEGEYLQKKTDCDNEAEILAEIDGRIVGTAGIERVGKHEKLAHRCDFGVSVEKDYWGLGIGKALLYACIDCAKRAGYRQMELEVVADNDRAVKMYQNAGFVEYGRNPRDFLSRYSGYQEVIYMRLELTED